MRKTKLWIDDVRLPPDEYNAWCTNARDAIRFIDEHWGKIQKISFDHDLGDDDYGTGYDVIKFIEERVFLYSWEPLMEFAVHTDNAAGMKNIRAAIDSIQRRHEQNKAI
jgi:hypothetical protein